MDIFSFNDSDYNVGDVLYFSWANGGGFATGGIVKFNKKSITMKFSDAIKCSLRSNKLICNDKTEKLTVKGASDYHTLELIDKKEFNIIKERVSTSNKFNKLVIHGSLHNLSIKSKKAMIKIIENEKKDK